MSPTRYRIVLRGRLSGRFAAAFAGMALASGSDHSVLVGEVCDQALSRACWTGWRDFGMELVAVEPAGRGDAGG